MSITVVYIYREADINQDGRVNYEGMSINVEYIYREADIDHDGRINK